MKNLPATSQVTAQQGTYLADCFNRMEECEKNPEGPIHFRDSGRHRFRPFRFLLARAASGSGIIFMQGVARNMKNLPATSQVAAQRGTYLADCFNRMDECEKNPEGPIRFRDSGRHRF
ncbi:hypothetical protein Tco_0657643 [Tanacetum coccineum]